MPLGEVANFVTDYFPLKIKFLAKRNREFTTKFAILPNGGYSQWFLFWHCVYVSSSGTSKIIGTLDLNAFPTAIACLNFKVGKAFIYSGPK